MEQLLFLDFSQKGLENAPKCIFMCCFLENKRKGFLF
jgi:hypothetical protein